MDNSPTCKNCKFAEYHSQGSFRDSPLFTCDSPHINVHPNYYEDSGEETKIDGMETTYLPKFGADYGCVHFEKRN